MNTKVFALCFIVLTSEHAFANPTRFIYQDSGKPNNCSKNSATIWALNDGEVIAKSVPEAYQGKYAIKRTKAANKATLAYFSGKEISSTATETRLVKNPACGDEPVFERINNLAQYYRQKSVQLSPSDIPPEIGAPTLPKPPVLEKDQFETKDQFQSRVNAAMQDRDGLIEKTQKKYRADVTARNTRIAELKRQQENQITTATSDPMYFYGKAFQAVMGKPIFTPKSYDAERQVMFFDFKASTADFGHPVMVEVPLASAKAIYAAIEQYQPQLHYNMLKDSLQLSSVTLIVGEQTFTGSQTDEAFKPEAISVALVDEKVLKTDDNQLALQNPNLIDKFRLSAVLPSSSIEIQNELLTSLNNSEAVAEDKTKWLFNISIENYANTDNVIYSRRSGEAVTLAANKLLGVPKRHTYALYDEQATSGAIKDKLKLMLSHVKKDDTVYFYYNGHGIPVLPDNEPYLLPQDKIPDFIKDDDYFRLNNIYHLLSSSQAGSVVAFIDSCFSGATDGVSIIKGVAASRLVPKKVGIDATKMAVLTAGRNKEYSNMYAEKGHRLFSYHLLQELLQGTRQLSELHNVVSGQVQESSFEMGDLKQQHPEMFGNANISL